MLWMGSGVPDLIVLILFFNKDQKNYYNVFVDSNFVLIAGIQIIQIRLAKKVWIKYLLRHCKIIKYKNVQIAKPTYSKMVAVIIWPVLNVIMTFVGSVDAGIHPFIMIGWIHVIVLENNIKKEIRTHIPKF